MRSATPACCSTKLLPDNPQEFTGALAPAQWYLLTENKDLIDRDINAESNGSYGQAIISSVARIPLVKINAMPRVDESALASIPAKYRGNFADTVGVIFHRSAVGTLAAGPVPGGRTRARSRAP